MTPDIEQIRAALAAATPFRDGPITVRRTQGDHDRYLAANAPVWLASLCDEIESLNALLAHMQKQRDAALQEIERLRAMFEITLFEKVADERNAALATIDELMSTDTDVEISQNYVDGEPTTRVMRIVYRGPNHRPWVRLSTEMAASMIEEHNDLSKRLAAALAECERLRARLREEMGVES